jgi:hypothetical protein
LRRQLFQCPDDGRPVDLQFLRQLAFRRQGPAGDQIAGFDFLFDQLHQLLIERHAPILIQSPLRHSFTLLGF